MWEQLLLLINSKLSLVGGWTGEKVGFNNMGKDIDRNITRQYIVTWGAFNTSNEYRMRFQDFIPII